MLTLTPQILVSTVTALGSWERQRKANDGEAPRARVETKRGVASLRFVHFTGFWSHYTPGRHCSSWPLPPIGGFGQLGEFARKHRVVAEGPDAGDVFLLASVASRDRHNLAGVVVAVESVATMMDGCPAFVCVTAEGEVHGAVEAPHLAKAHLVRRKLSSAYGDLFIRWSDLPAVVFPGTGERTAVRYEVPDTLLTLKPQRRRAA